MTLRLTAGAADRIAGGHEGAASAIDGSAAGAPACPDAGYGAGHVADILSAVTGTAGEIAVVNAGIARLVRDAADDIGRTEDQVAKEFDTMAGVG